MNNSTILQVENLKTVFSSRGQEVQAVRGVSFEVNKGEIVGLVGESGSGKSVTMKAILGILPENAKTSADILRFQDKDLLSLNEEEYRKMRGKEMTMIFQDPMTALNPLKKIGAHLEEVIMRHSSCSKAEAKTKAIENAAPCWNPDARNQNEAVCARVFWWYASESSDRNGVGV